jgi:hypothetical protein
VRRACGRIRAIGMSASLAFRPVVGRSAWARRLHPSAYPPACAAQGGRVHFPNDERTKLGFKYNHGRQYWFNFAQAEDDIIAPKTNTRGNVYEAYLTHRISDRFVFKADYIYYDYNYSARDLACRCNAAAGGEAGGRHKTQS